MPLLRSRWIAVSVLGLAAGCHDGVTPPDSGITVGESFAVTGAQSVKLQPGMPAQVMLVTGERRAISYFVDPITDRMRGAFRER